MYFFRTTGSCVPRQRHYIRDKWEYTKCISIFSILLMISMNTIIEPIFTGPQCHQEWDWMLDIFKNHCRGLTKTSVVDWLINFAFRTFWYGLVESFAYKDRTYFSTLYIQSCITLLWAKKWGQKWLLDNSRALPVPSLPAASLSSRKITPFLPVF